MTNKYFLYARVSTGNQQTGLEAQIRALKEYCKTRGIEDYVIYQDENQSGTKSSRPALDQMMKAIRNGEARGVIVYSFSRYARSVTHLLSALNEFKKIGVRFISMTESIDTDTPLGIALFTILGAVAQLERDLIAERVRNGLANAIAKGIKVGRKRLRPSELIRRLRRSGVSYQEIARICKTSQGSVGAEIKLWKAELAKAGRTIQDEMKDQEAQAEALRNAPAIEIDNPDGSGGTLELSNALEMKLEIIR